MDAVVGALRAVLSLESAAFTRGLTSAQKSLADFDKRMRNIGGGIAKVGAVISVASTGIALAVKKQLDTADEMSKASQKFGVPIEALSQLAHAADLSDVSFEALGTSLGKLSKGLVNSPKAFTDLGIAVEGADGQIRPIQTVLGDLADKFAAMPDGAEKTALAIKLFGKSGADMIPLLNGGSAALAEMAAEADALGLTIDQKTGSAAEAFNDNITRLQGAMTGLANQVTAALAPGLEMLSQQIVNLTQWFQNLSPEAKQVIAWAAGITVVLGPLLVGLGALVSSLGLVAGAIGAVTAFTLANPVFLAIAALAAAAAAIYLNWDKIAAFFTETWASVTQSAQAAWDSIKAAWEGASDMFTVWLAGVKIAFINGWEAIKALTAQWIADFLEVGQAIVDGLKRGIEEKWNAMVDWFYAKGQALSDGIKDVFGIQSPSKVFREIGQWITEGLGLGIQDNAPMVDSAMDGLAAGINGKSDSLTSGMEDFKSTAGQAFTSFVTGAQSAKEALGQVLDSLASSLASSAFDGVFGAIAGALGFKSKSANGNVFRNGRLSAFANGGIVTGPTVFPMAKGAGLMGEAGPEAIMPLTRIGGKLGVRAQGGGGTTIQIDARYASEGTAEMIVRALQQAAPGIVKQAVGASRGAAARGY